MPVNPLSRPAAMSAPAVMSAPVVPAAPLAPEPDPVPPTPEPVPAVPTLRYVLGPSFGASKVDPNAPAPVVDPNAPPAKEDIQVVLGAVDESAWTVGLSIPAYDPATTNVLAEVRTYLIPPGQPVPATADEFIASSLPYTPEDVSAYQTGAEATLNLPDVPPGRFLGQIVLGFAT